ncbi:hypothetical protein JKP88DRAFT_318719 [Tribonema minus]|uniref:BZIP domain-containing protein n=1 Tax=Tribonema minus TaxID=303371 RepID=A0A836CDJ1_9STRA|nr:hypothetical protein JKP88DRAFT_318719 [Tribonema minus]
MDEYADAASAAAAAAAGAVAYAGQKRPAHSNADQALSEKRLRRLEKNRMSARECRRRKKEHVQALQRQLAGLEADNLELRLKLKIGDEAREREADDEIAGLKQRLQEMVSKGAGEGDILAAMDVLKTKFADYGRDRTSAAIFHLDELQDDDRGLFPPRLQQDPASSSALMAAAGMGAKLKQDTLWNTLVRVLQITPQQEELLASKVAIAQAMDEDLHNTLQLVAGLRSLLCTKNESLDDEMAQIQRILSPTQIQRILSPTQTAKFILWVSRNAACMHMLNQLWTQVHEQPEEGITSETTVARGASSQMLLGNDDSSSGGGGGGGYARSVADSNSGSEET